MRLAVAALTLIAAMALPCDALGAFPGDNGRLSITSDSECDFEVLNVLTLEPDTHEFEPTGGNYNVLGNGESATWSPDGQRLAYEWLGNLITQNGDGSGDQTISNDGYLPAWSPDGQRIAYQKLDEEIHVIDADGSGDVTLTSNAASDNAPAWSPDGSKIAFASERDGNFEIYMMDPDGGNQTRLTTNPGFDYAPNWSPDGSKIAFSRDSNIWVMAANGSGQTVLPSSEKGGGDPAWSPDGSRIAFEGASGIYAMNTDGSDLTLIDSGCGYQPDWQPLLRGYVRPKGATPTRVPLVPAAKPCTSPNSTHGAPLSYGSCGPPQPEATATFLGIGDGNPVPARSIGSVLLKALLFTPGPEDDADVSIDVRITHVLNASDHADYTGELRLELPLRITDRFNRPHPNVNGPGTVADTSFFATVPCAATPSDLLTGSTCELSSTADALLPGTARQGARAVWGLGQVRLHDGGADGDAETAGDNGLLAVQGVFIP